MDSTLKGRISDPTFTPPAALISATAISTAFKDSLPSKNPSDVETPITTGSAAQAAEPNMKQTIKSVAAKLMNPFSLLMKNLLFLIFIQLVIIYNSQGCSVLTIEESNQKPPTALNHLETKQLPDAHGMSVCFQPSTSQIYVLRCGNSLSIIFCDSDISRLKKEHVRRLIS
jgi:hypothetical protein